jgi:hypothetical protein
MVAIAVFGFYTDNSPRDRNQRVTGEAKEARSFWLSNKTGMNGGIPFYGLALDGLFVGAGNAQQGGAPDPNKAKKLAVPPDKKVEDVLALYEAKKYEEFFSKCMLEGENLRNFLLRSTVL